MGDTVHTDTYGEITRAELDSMRADASTCLTCGMRATVDPIAHQSRYGHAPVIADGRDRLTWSTARMVWAGAPMVCPACSRATIERRAGGVFHDYGTGHPHTCGVTPGSRRRDLTT